MMRFSRNNKRIIFIGLFLSACIILNGCGGNIHLPADVVYKYSGSIGVGDFVDFEINLTDKTYQFTNHITEETGSGTFREINRSFYEITSGFLNGNKFTILADQILIVSVNEAEPGEGLITALKKANIPYGDEIGGTYNVVTSLEGWIGNVIIDPANSTINVKLDMNGDGDYEDYIDDESETLPTMNYTFDEEFSALKIIENEEFRHFGVFLNNDVGVFDSYIWDGADWAGDGMFILVKQQSSLIDLLDYSGKYTYIDVDAEYGTFELIGNEDSLKFFADGEDTEITFRQSDIVNGVISFEANLLGSEYGTQAWNFVLLPDQVIIVASSDDVSFGGEGDGGLAIGVKSD